MNVAALALATLLAVSPLAPQAPVESTTASTSRPLVAILSALEPTCSDKPCRRGDPGGQVFVIDPVRVAIFLVDRRCSQPARRRVTGRC